MRRLVPSRLPHALATAVLAATGCGGDTSADGTTPTPGQTPAAYANPVVPGQYPDPTAMRDGETYYLSTTSRAWAPIFPLLRSTDLVRWKRVGAVLPRAPRWAAGPFWAPEFARWGEETRVYYTARPRERRDLPCIGVASARSPAGPYRDRGPVLCPPSGAIDAEVADDEHGRPFLLYRRYVDGGGIWAVRLTRDGLRTAGAAREVLPATDEDGRVVEGPEIVRRDGVFHLLFAAGNCCRPPCDYRQAVARSRSLVGPYERAPRLLLSGTERWRCPGHGTLVDTPAGESWFVHHAVASDDPVNARRTTLLEPVRWDDDGWPVIGDDGAPVEAWPAPAVGDSSPPPATGGVTSPPAAAPAPPADPGPAPAPPVPVAPNLTAPRLDVGWEWPWDRPVRATPGRGGLRLAGDPRGAVLGRQIPAGRVRAEVRTRPDGCAAGLAAVTNTQDGGESIGIELLPTDPATGRARLRVWRGRTGQGPGATIAIASAPASGRLALAATVGESGRRVRFAVGDGEAWRDVGPAVAGTSDVHRLLRVALTCRGTRDSSATFDRLSVAPSG